MPATRPHNVCRVNRITVTNTSADTSRASVAMAQSGAAYCIAWGSCLATSGTVMASSAASGA